MPGIDPQITMNRKLGKWESLPLVNKPGHIYRLSSLPKPLAMQSSYIAKTGWVNSSPLDLATQPENHSVTGLGLSLLAHIAADLNRC
jgi:hypothetical protein